MKTAIGFVIAFLLFAGAAQGECLPASGTSAEAWALSCLKRGLEADFDVQCGKGGPRPQSDSCRALSHTFVETAMSDSVPGATLPYQGVRLKNAFILGDVDLEGAKIPHNVAITDSRIEGGVNIARAKIAFRLSLEGSIVTGTIEGGGARIDSDLRLERVSAKELKLIGANIDGFAQFSGLTIEKKDGFGIVLNNARIRDDLLLANRDGSQTLTSPTRKSAWIYG